MSKTFSYGSNTTTSTVQYNVKASIGSLSQEQKFSVPAGEECQDKYVLIVPNIIYCGWSAGTTTSISIKSSLNGAAYPFKVTDELSGATASLSNNELEFTTKQNGGNNPERIGIVAVKQERKDGQSNIQNIDVWQKGIVRLKSSIDGLTAHITSNIPLPCQISGTLTDSYSHSSDFTIPLGATEYSIHWNPGDIGEVHIEDIYSFCYDQYDISYW